ncbi:hypothetical protein [Streptomyces sp. CBMA156]|uniref:hypothetical protein n=1 Tax=Streptomyces sp. CBMA156 TaxID=1930280 RepID=UPI001661C104|nr:hypothetical protein [Streptomyces sp. CBMA156]MBD0675907.1 hypothetical protein [Streptomyces sp. CBMA156]
MLPAALHRLAACQRTLIVALGLVPLVMVIAVCLPALVLLPALPGGVARCSTLITLFRGWTEAVLTKSR